MKDFSDILGVFANILGIVSFFPIVYAAYKYLTNERHKKKLRIRIIENKEHVTCAALAICMGQPTSIENQVKVFIKNNENMRKEFKVELEDNDIGNVFSIHVQDQLIRDNSVAIDILRKKLVTTQNVIKENAINRIHLFYQGPVSAVSVVAAELANRFTVLCYQYDRSACEADSYYFICLMQDS